MTATPDGGDWTALIDRIRGGKSNRRDWVALRSYFGEKVLTAIREALDPLVGEAWEIDLTRELERGFWKQCRRTCETLPSDRSNFEAKLIETARTSAQHVAEEYVRFQARIAECQPQEMIEAALRSAFLPDAEAKRVEGLDGQVIAQMWHSRHKLASDCEGFNKRAFEVASMIGSLSRTVVGYQSGDRHAGENLFKEIHLKMTEICGRAFPRIPPHDRKDIVQNAALKLLRTPRSFEPGRVATLTALIRTVVINAGIDWLNQNRNHA